MKVGISTSISTLREGSISCCRSITGQWHSIPISVPN